MATTSLTETDLRVREAVVRQLDWDPHVDSSALGVAARNGVVTLTGFIDSYAGKLAAERAAKRVYGVRAVANDIDVRLRLERTDADLADDAARALELRVGVPDNVQAVVHHGHVTLTGRVGWRAQRNNAEKAVGHLRGIRGVFNHIAIEPGRAEIEVEGRSPVSAGSVLSLPASEAGTSVAQLRRQLPSLSRLTMTDTCIEQAMKARICAEYLEMPGLRLTSPQAARLFNLEPSYCARLLEALVQAGLLWTNGREFLASNAGRRCA